MPLQATSGAASYDAFGGGVPFEPIYIEQVFQNWLYTGNGSTQTITNGIDLAGKGGLVWTKFRANATSTTNHILVDTVRGPNRVLCSNTTDDSFLVTNATVFGSTGFTMGVGTPALNNENNATYASWTFREQPKFFDVVTWTGTSSGSSTRAIPHNLGSTPGFIVVKVLNATSDWVCYHRSLGSDTIRLNATSAASSVGDWGTIDSSVFTVTNVGNGLNFLGQTYVAYLFAHNAGGFGLTGTDNVISCGSFTHSFATDSTVNLGYEPQFVLLKDATSAGGWKMYDTMRGASLTEGAELTANTSNAESAKTPPSSLNVTATGFVAQGFVTGTGTTIYIAIRRGPMKTPTTGTSVYNAIIRNGTQANATVTGVGFPVDLAYTSLRPAGTHNPVLSDRLRGAQRTLSSRGTQAEQTEPLALTSFASMDGVSLGADNTGFWNGFNSQIGSSYVNWFFRRAPGFFDEVCYTGTGSATTFAHNLAAVPELIIIKNRGVSSNWAVNVRSINTNNWVLNLEEDTARFNNALFSSAPTSTTMTFTGAQVNAASNTYVAYLFASAPGVSKVFSYTGNGSSQTINCGFTGGARFVMVKRTDSTGNWLVVDTARGLVSAGDPTLYLNSTAAEVTGVDWIDPDNSGFIVNQEGTMNANVSSATYIGLAIA